MYSIRANIYIGGLNLYYRALWWTPHREGDADWLTLGESGPARPVSAVEDAKSWRWGHGGGLRLCRWNILQSVACGGALGRVARNSGQPLPPTSREGLPWPLDPAVRLREQHERRKRHSDDARVVDERRVLPRTEQTE